MSDKPLIEETSLKRRRTLDELSYQRSITVGAQQKRKRVVRGEDVKVKRPEQLLKESAIKKGSLNKMMRRKKQQERMSKTNFSKVVKNSTGFVIRIHEGRHTSTEISKQLHELGLHKKYDAVFMMLDEEAISKLKSLDSYIAYGYISKKSVEELVHRRAFTNIDGKRKALSDNMIVEKALGSAGIICLNDLSNELYTVGEHYKSCMNILCTFKLASPVGGYEKKVLNVHDKVELTGGGFLDGTKMETFLCNIL